ncbi:hypothetical protein COB21_01855 [Candidatus Aerophobetes bacterium]|uniref:Biotin transporter n=1 Tax=Aerophobetes bacterium TaxID=2030807 RepID=A0A2A4X7G2_UNCAE|nr:MAG: hypothetical protein COB21_01855 [Candidatus Aerophobetes bacterium]
MSKLQNIFQAPVIFSKASNFLASDTQLAFGAKAFMASMVLAVSAWISFPLYPVPVYLLPNAIVLLALFGGARLGFYAALFYLVEASIGLPVLSGGRIDPLWLFTPVAGYILSYPLVVFVTGWVSERWGKSVVATLAAVVLGQVVLYTCGVANLTRFFGLDVALKVGFYSFGIKALVNLVSTTAIYKIFTGLKLSK